MRISWFRSPHRAQPLPPRPTELDRRGSTKTARSARPIRLSAGEFTTERMLRPAPNVPSGGWRRAVFTLSGGHIAMGPSPEELRQRELVARVKTPVAGCRKIAFISRKGGVGKTSTCLLVGHTFAIHRGDRVIAGRRQSRRRNARTSRPERDDREPHVAPRRRRPDRAVRRCPRLHLSGAEQARSRRVG